MEGDTEDEDGLFDLGDDDDEVDDDVAGELVPNEQDELHQATDPTDEGETLLEALSVREEGAMGNDPYNSEDWDVLAGAETEAGEASYDPYDDYGDGMSADGDANDDVNSLIDDGLEEVDGILRMKGRLSYAGAAEGPEVTDPRVSESTGPTIENRTARPERDCPGPNFPEHSARGTGAQAANTLKSTTVTAAAIGVAPLVASHPPGGYPTQAAIASNASIDLHGAEPGQSGAHHASASGDNSHFPPRRRANKKLPFIQAKGISLTYAQAKLFGLAGGNDASQTAKGAATRPRSRQVSGKGGSGDHVEKERRYSPSRMERLARPVPGRGVASAVVGRAGVGGGAHEGGERGEGPSFTWKRSRKAEAAMRDPACGYDFVREAGYKREGFLGRMEAYTSYTRAKQEMQRAQDLYDTQLDKLECPQCQNPQSYDEFASKKLKCPSCEVTYCMSRTWNRRIWEERDKMRLAKSVERQARVEREVEEEFLRRMPRHTRHAAVLRQRVGQVDFIRRMRRDLQRRRAREESPTKLQQSTAGDDPQQKASAAAAAAAAAAALTTSKNTRPASAPIGSTKRRTAAPHHVVSRGRRDDNEITDVPATTAPPASEQATEQLPLASSPGEELLSSADRLRQPVPRAATTSTTTTTTTTTTAKIGGLVKGASSRPSATTRPASAGERMIATRMRNTRTGSDSRGRPQAKPTPETVPPLSTVC